MHPKAKKRMLLLLAITSTLGVGIGGLFVYRKLAIRQEFASARASGLEHSAAGRHAEAVADLEKYLGRQPNDVEALSAFAKSRLRVPAPRGAHVLNAANALRRAVNLEPTRLDDRRVLAGLLLEIGQLPEALDEAEFVLRARPGDVESLGNRATVLVRLRRSADAARATRDWAQAAPDDPRALLQAAGAAAENGATPTEVHAIADAMIARATRELPKALLRSVLAASAGDRSTAQREAIIAASQPTTSETEVRLVSAHLESMGLLEQSAAYLARAAENNLLGGGKLMPARRLLESGRYDLLAGLLSAEPTDPRAEGFHELSALRAIALAGTGDLPGARAALTTLQGDTSPRAVAWALLVEQVIQTNATERPERVIAVINAAVREGEAAPVMALFLAEAYGRAGETERAVAIYDDLSRRSVGWARPLERKAGLLTSLGQPAAAMDAAIEAVRRRPQDPGPLTMLAEAWSAAVAMGVRTDVADLNNFLGQLSTAMGGDFTLAPSRVLTLARANRQREAVAVIESVKARVAQRSDPAWAPMLLRLASIAASTRLDGAEQLVDLAEIQAGVTANSALTRALVVAMRSPDAIAPAIRRFQADYDAADRSASVDWMVSRARLLGAAADPGAAAAWIQVADKFPDNLAVQNEAIGSVRGEVDFRRRVIERLRAGSGSTVGAWRLAEVRLLLDTGADAREINRAAEDLNDYLRRAPSSIDARVLLALCLDRVGSTGAAIEQLRNAVRQNPDVRTASLLLAEFLQKRGDFAGAGRVLDEALARNLGGTNERRGVASLLANQGDPDRAISLLGQEGDAAAPDLLLARLHRQRGDLAAAEAESRKVVDASPDLGSLRLYAEVLRARGKIQEAAQALDRLGELKLEPGVVEMARADYHLRFLEIDLALDAATRATQAAPANVFAWQAVASVRAASGDVEGAVAAIESAASNVPGDATVQALRVNADLIRRSITDPVTRPLVVSLLQRSDDTTLLDALKTPTSGSPADGGPGPSLVRVRQLAERYPLSLQIQMLAVRRLLQFGLYPEAGQLAARASQAFPTSPEPAALAASTFAQASDWSQTLIYTRLWRTRSTADSLVADLATAEALLKLGRPNDAVAQLRGYLADFAKDPRALLPALFRTAEALTVAGEFDQASRLLEPHLTGNTDLLVAWIAFAHERLDAPLAARWNRHLRSHPDANAPAVRWELARTQATALSRLKHPDAPAARTALADLARSPGHDARHLLLAALVHDEADALSDAEALYRAVLKADPANAVAGNNLAMVLVRASRDLEGAQSAAQAVANAQPQVATFHDTLASVLAARGRFDLAEASVRKAIDLEPANPEWWIHLAEIRLRTGNSAGAREVIDGIRIIPDTALPPSLKLRLDAVRSAPARPAP